MIIKRYLAMALAMLALPCRGADIQWLDDAVVQKAKKSIVSVTVNEAFSVTGFFVSDDGLIVVPAGAMEAVTTLRIHTASQQVIKEAKLLAIDPEYDLAVLRTKFKPASHLNLRASPASAGDPCVLLYCDERLSLRAFDGVLLNFRMAIDWSETHFHKLWTVALPPTAGSTGSPLVTADGCVAGIFNFVNGGGITGLSFAGPASAVQAIVDKARKAAGPLPFPRRGQINRDSLAEGDRDYIAGMVLSGKGDRAGANEKFRAAQKRHPQSALVLMQVYGTGRNSDAEREKLVRDMIAIAPDKLLTRVYLGEIIRDLNGPEKAIDYFRELVTQHPDLHDAWMHLADLLFKSGQKSEAAVASARWTELQPESFEAWDLHALALSATGDLEAATRARDKSSALETLLFNIRYRAPKRE